MSIIALYQLLRRIPDVTDGEARAAADSIAQVDEVATKADLVKLEAALKTDLHRLETKLTGLIYRVVLSATVVILAGVGLMLTFIPPT